MITNSNFSRGLPSSRLLHNPAIRREHMNVRGAHARRRAKAIVEAEHSRLAGLKIDKVERSTVTDTAKSTGIVARLKHGLRKFVGKIW